MLTLFRRMFCLVVAPIVFTSALFANAAHSYAAGIVASSAVTFASRDASFNGGWRFWRDDNAGDAAAAAGSAPAQSDSSFDDTQWDQVILPHTPRIEAYNQFLPWQGICWYRKAIVCPQSWSGKRVTLEFQGAMQVADVWVNGKYRLTHYGGFLPFTLDLSGDVAPGKTICVAVQVNNRDNGLVPPGKPLQNADFEYYGGLYRDVILHVTDPLYITDPVAANKVAGGGVFVTFPQVSRTEATVHIETDVQNDYGAAKNAEIICSLKNDQGTTVATSMSQPVSIAAGSDMEIPQDLHVTAPKLWSPDHPNLYRIFVVAAAGSHATDAESFIIGIRRFEFSTQTGFTINGQSLFLHGANRHQYYPWIGDALSDNEQYRDMVRVKEEGWNFVRLCHYPQSPQIMDACDRLGLIALVCSPGWQWYQNDPVFISRVDQADRDMVRWHRNHASAMLWEVTLNETYAPIDKVKAWGQSIRQELPGDQCFLSGDTKDYGDPKDFDLDCPYPGWNNPENTPATADTSRKRLVREYGAQAQSILENGEKDMLNQVSVAEESYSQIRRQPLYMGAARWSYMDYVRGFANYIYYSGTVTIDRIPKFLFYFHKSQFPPTFHTALYDSGSMVYIANYWTPKSPTDVTIFSNCDQVELFVNGVSVGKRSPNATNKDIAVDHPPFTFPNVAFAPGTLKAVGYFNGHPAASETVTTPGQPAAIKLSAEEMGRPLAADGNDEIFVRAVIVDSSGTRVPDSSLPITFSCTPNGTVIGDNPRAAGAGISSFLLKAGTTPGPITVTAAGPGLTTGTLVVQAAMPTATFRAWR